MRMTHSLSSGRATAALRTPGSPVRLVQRHGGWQRNESLEGYVEESLESLLACQGGWAERILYALTLAIYGLPPLLLSFTVCMFVNTKR